MTDPSIAPEQRDVEAELAEQRRYYRARAPEYDQWWDRTGRYDRGPAYGAVWDADVAAARDALDGFDPGGDVLELAAGTGNWTRELVRFADRVTAVDASPETLAINRAKLGTGAPVELVEADVFGFEPERQYDVVFFSFWLSHVPDDRFESFWNLVGRCLRPDGRVFIIDNAHPRLTADVPGSPLRVGRATAATSQGEIDLEAGTAERTLIDGRRFRIVKRYWEPPELVERLRGLGWSIEARTTSAFFLLANGSRL